MARVTIEKRKKIGSIEEIVSKEYEIPDMIICSKDKNLMFFKSSTKTYVCMSQTCDHEISVEDYIKAQIAKQKKKSSSHTR